MLPAEIMAALEEAEVVLGSDEAGLGAYAGPLVVGVVLAPKGWVPTVAITDSKKMTEADRERAARALIEDKRIYWRTLWTQSPEIDVENVYYANVRMHTEAIKVGLVEAAVRFPGKKVLAVVDGSLEIPHAFSLPKGDRLVPVCSAASILAKVARDTWMVEKMAVEWPDYGFQNHKGYGGNPEHTAALEKHGPCAIHRRSFDPIARLLKRQEPDFYELMDAMGDD